MIIQEPFAAYVARPELNFSTLKHIDKSDLQFRYVRNGGDVKVSSGYGLGRAYHTATLEPELFADCYVRMPDYWERPVSKGRGEDKTTTIKKIKGQKKKGVPEYDAMIANGHEALTPKEWSNATEMAKAVHRDRIAGPMLDGSRKELTVLTKYRGHEIKSRIDIVGDGFIADLKSASNFTRRSIMGSISSYDYHVQAAMYQLAWRLETGEELPFEWIFGETSKPYDVAVIPLNNEERDDGLVKLDSWIDSLDKATESGLWNGISLGEKMPYTPPGWARHNEETSDDADGGYDWSDVEELSHEA